MGFRNAIHGIRPGTIGPDELAPDAVGEEHLRSDAITAKHTLTGPLVRTAASGVRWELSSSPANELRGYGSLGASPQPGKLSIDDSRNASRLTNPRRTSTAEVGHIEVRSDVTTGNAITQHQASGGHSFLLGAISAAAGLKIGSTQRLDYLGFGTRVVTLNPGSFALGINHDLGVIPDLILIGLRRSNWWQYNVTNRTTTTFDLEIRNSTGASVAGDEGTIVYAAFAFV